MASGMAPIYDRRSVSGSTISHGHRLLSISHGTAAAAASAALFRRILKKIMINYNFELCQIRKFVTV